ncbi:unnamed protein product, partial [marine sediment metagenome]
MAHDFKRFPELTNNQMEFYYNQSPHKQIVEDFRAVVTKVTDGDTIRVEAKFRNFDFPIRLSDIAAPELNEKGGVKAKKWLENRILNQPVDIIINYKNRVEKWGRLLGKVYNRGISMNDELVNLGHAL